MIKTIEYNGKVYPYRVGYKALKKVKAKLGRDYQHTADTDYEALEYLMFYAIETGCAKSDTKFDLKFEDMEDLLDEHISDILSNIRDFSQAANQQAAEK